MSFMLDFNKAFDSDLHNRLGKQIQAHGISDKIEHWISSWLIKKQQIMVVRSQIWHMLKISQGFILFFGNTVISLTKFAGDIKVLRYVPDIAYALTI